MPEDAKEGIFRTVDNESIKTYSVTEIELQDLIAEGEIEGLCRTEYEYEGVLGETGYRIATPKSKDFLSSVYWNEVPVVDKAGDFNFSTINVKESVGVADGSVNTNNPEEGKIVQETQKTRQIGENLKGPTFKEISPDVWSRETEPDIFAKYYRVLNTEVSKIRVGIRIESLFQTKDEDNSVIDSKIDLNVSYRPIFSNPTLSSQYTIAYSDSIVGRVNNAYIHVIDIPTVDTNFTNQTQTSFIGWEIKIWKSSREAAYLNEGSTTTVDHITEIYSERFSYPNSAVVYSKFAAEDFTNIPQRAFDVRLSKVKIPNIYDPVKRSYIRDTWDGTFSETKQWTDNPAWCFYDLITNDRYGLGKFIDPTFVDKWTLFEIARYCDVLVSDGFGGLEPRFSCNLYIQSREDAFKVVNDLASIFRGILYYSAGQIYTIQDREKEPVYQFNNSNVIDGSFTYANSSSKVRHNVAIVRYNDKTNFYKPAVEYIENVDGIRRNGIKELEMTAFGCTSRGQALRYGRWALFTENFETETVNFKAGIEANYIKPGDIITVTDKYKTQKNRGGRASVVGKDGTTVKLDRVLDVDQGREYKITFLTPTYNYDPVYVDVENSDDFNNIRRSHLQTKNITIGPSVTGFVSDDNTTVSTVTLPDALDTSNYSATGHFDILWSIEPASTDYTASTLDEAVYESEKYRVISIQENDSLEYSVSAIEYSQAKFDAIENGLSFDDETVTIIPEKPGAITFEVSADTVDSNTKELIYRFKIPDGDPPKGVSTFKVYIRKNIFAGNDHAVPSDEFLVDTRHISEANVNREIVGTFIPSSAGTYFIRVFSANILGQTSAQAVNSSVAVDNVNPIKDINVQSLRLSSDSNSTNLAGQKDGSQTIYTTESPTFNWEMTTSLNQGVTSDLAFRLSIRQKSSNNVPHTNILFQETGIRPIGNEANFQFHVTGNAFQFGNFTALRDYDVVVEAHDSEGRTSAGGTFSNLGVESNNFSNSNGYDILSVDNPKIAPVLSAEGAACASSDDLCTEQELSIDKSIKLIFQKNNFEDKTRGGFLYVSTRNFNQSEINQKVNIPSDIEVIKFNYNNVVELFSADSARRAADKLYIAYSLFDIFDEQVNRFRTDEQSPIFDSNFDFKSILNVSNVIAIEKDAQSVIKVGGQGFKTWIKIDLEGNWEGQGISYVKKLNVDSTVAGHNDANSIEYIPQAYKDYKGFLMTWCHADQYSIGGVIQVDRGGENWGTLGNWRMKSEPFEVPTCGFNLTKEIGKIDKQLKDGTYRGGSRTDINHGFVRYRVVLDGDNNFPPDNDYSIIGVNSHNGSYEPFMNSNIHPKFQNTTTLYNNIDPDKEIKVQKIVNGKLVEVTINEKERFKEIYFGESIPGESYLQVGTMVYVPGNMDPEPPATHKVTEVDYYSNTPQYNHHPAGFGQGFANLLKSETAAGQKYFDVQLGWLVDNSYLKEGFFAMIRTENQNNKERGKAS
tara:strand:+ start:379 stop:4797 length:4419 start_codon:yes stop_codon:yes gene_type:complete